MDAPTPKLDAEQATVPERTTWPRFLRFWFAGTAALLLLVAGLNIVVDPFFIFSAPLIHGFNQYKPATQGHEALAKPVLLSRMQPHTVLIGTSKVQVGLDPDSAAWQPEDRPVFNDGLPGRTSPLTLTTMKQALAVAPVRRVLVLLEPIDLLRPAAPSGPAAPAAGWVHMDDLLQALLTRDALQASISTVIGQRSTLPSGLRPNGQMYDGIFRGPTLAEGPGALFGQKAPLNARQVVEIARSLQIQPDATISQLDVLRQIVASCREKGVALDLALAPVHADLLRLFDLAGLWPRYLLMREELARTVAEAGGDQIRLWNFTGFNIYSTEPVPPLGHRAPPLRWFWEPNHFRPEYGELLLETIYHNRDGVGTLLNPVNTAALNQAQTTAMEADRVAQLGEWARAATALARAQTGTDR